MPVLLQSRSLVLVTLDAFLHCSDETISDFSDCMLFDSWGTTHFCDGTSILSRSTMFVAHAAVVRDLSCTSRSACHSDRPWDRAKWSRDKFTQCKGPVHCKMRVEHPPNGLYCNSSCLKCCVAIVPYPMQGSLIVAVPLGQDLSKSVSSVLAVACVPMR